MYITFDYISFKYVVNLLVIMGRVRTTLVKRTGKTLVENNPEMFNHEFEHNKKAVSDAAEIHSKKLRNMIAGYATKIAKSKR